VFYYYSYAVAVVIGLPVEVVVGYLRHGFFTKLFVELELSLGAV
jgi:hypothetical protein